MTNFVAQSEDVAEHLQQISHLFMKAKEPWKSRAFSKVAGELRIKPQRIEIIDGTLMNKIDGVGDAIRDVIIQFASCGTSEKMAKLKNQSPNEVVERFDASVCKRKVNELLEPLTKAGIDWGYAGSMRRGLKTVKDVDVIVCLRNEAEERALITKILEDAKLTPDVRNGQEKVGVSIYIKNQARAFTLDLNFCYPENRGAYYLYFTGPKAYNINQRGLMKAKGLLLNQKGLFKGTKKLAGETEEGMFEAMGLTYVEPNKRA